MLGDSKFVSNISIIYLRLFEGSRFVWDKLVENSESPSNGYQCLVLTTSTVGVSRSSSTKAGCRVVPLTSRSNIKEWKPSDCYKFDFYISFSYKTKKIKLRQRRDFKDGFESFALIPFQNPLVLMKIISITLLTCLRIHNIKNSVRSNAIHSNLPDIWQWFPARYRIPGHSRIHYLISGRIQDICKISGRIFSYIRHPAGRITR